MEQTEQKSLSQLGGDLDVTWLCRKSKLCARLEVPDNTDRPFGHVVESIFTVAIQPARKRAAVLEACYWILVLDLEPSLYGFGFTNLLEKGSIETSAEEPSTG